MGVCLVTGDVPRLRRFYHAVLEIAPEGDDAFVAFPVPGAVFSIYHAHGMEQMAPGSTQGMGIGSYTLEFEVADVDVEYARLQALGVTIVKPPATYPWGRRSVWFRDPDGNVVNFNAPA